MLTARDREIVEWIGRLGAAGAGDVMAHFGLGRTVAYRRLAACIDGGMLAAARLLHGEPAVLVATRRGLRWAGLEEFWVCRVSASTAGHWQACARLAVWLERAEPAYVVRSERELRVAERRAGRLFASPALGERVSGERSRVHRSDLLSVPRAGGRPVAVEVELSVKGARRLEAIVRGWARCRGVSAVRYYATPAAQRAVRRALDAVLAHYVVSVHPLPAGLISRGGTHGVSSRAAA